MGLKPGVEPGVKPGVWAAAGLVDTSLRSSGVHFELHRTEIAQRGVPPLGVVEALDVIKHVGLGLSARAVGRARRAFGLQRGEEALHRRIVPDIARPAHTAGDAVVGQEPLERLTGILAPPIRVMQDGLGLPPPLDRHHERIGDELRRHRRAHRPVLPHLILDRSFRVFDSPVRIECGR